MARKVETGSDLNESLAPAELQCSGGQVGTVELTVLTFCFNEQENIQELYDQITASLDGVFETYEILVIDDGSSDETPNILRRLHASDPRVRMLRFSRNFGQHVAMVAGLEHARGRYVVMMDADLQDPPDEIPRLYNELRAGGYDMVYGIRAVRKDNWFKRTTSFLFYRMLSVLSGQYLPPRPALLRIMTRRFVDACTQFRERSRFMTGVMSWVGFKQMGTPIRHQSRYAGQTKYSLVKLLRLTTSAVTSFSYVPLKMASWLGFFLSFVSVASAMFLVYRKMFNGEYLLGWPSLMTTILFVGGLQMLLLGVIGEYLGRTHSETQQRPMYIVEELLEASPHGRDDRPGRV